MRHTLSIRNYILLRIPQERTRGVDIEEFFVVHWSYSLI